VKILIVKTSSLGDLIHTFASLEYLRQKHPEAQIDWVVEAPFAEILKAHPCINQVIEIDSRNWRKGKNLKAFFQFLTRLREVRYDILFDFQGNTKSAIVTFFSRADKKIGFGKSNVAEWPNLLVTDIKVDPNPQLNVRQENMFLVQSYFQDFIPFQQKNSPLRASITEKSLIDHILKNPIIGNRRKVMVCPASAWKNKQMTKSSLINFLTQVDRHVSSCFLLIWGNEEERLHCKRLQDAFPDKAFLIDRLSLPALQNLMNQMDLVIAMDSLPLHLAATTSARVFGLFGPSSALKYMPEGSRYDFFQGICPYGKHFSKRCPILRTCVSGACLRGTVEDDVFKAYIK